MQGTSPCCEEGSPLKTTTMSNYLKSCTMTHGDREDMKTSCPSKIELIEHLVTSTSEITKHIAMQYPRLAREDPCSSAVCSNIKTKDDFNILTTVS